MKKLILLFVLICAANCGIHERLKGGQVHTPFAWVFADSATLMAESVDAYDTNRTALVLSDSSIWVLRDNSPKVWIKLYRNNDSGSFPCTLRTTGAFFGQTDTIGTVNWYRVKGLVYIKISDIDAKKISGLVYTYSFPDSLKADTSYESYQPSVPVGSYNGYCNAVFNYPLELGGGSGYNITFFGSDTIRFRNPTLCYKLLGY